MKLFVLLLAAFLLTPIAKGAGEPDFGTPGAAKLIHFDAALPVVPSRVIDVKYNLDLGSETFELFVPTNYIGQEPFGIFAFMSPGDSMSIPHDWYPLMEKYRLICLIPQRIGNNQQVGRRMGLTLTGILKLGEHFKIDRKRILAAGFSGGARCAMHLAFLHSDVITGIISVAGADFYQPVPRAKGKEAQGYGVWPAPADCVARARTNVSFVLIAGEKDPLRGNLQDIYEGGFVKNRFQTRYYELPDVGHKLCDPRTLEKAIRFIDER